DGVERIAGKYALTIGVVAHAGDGNTHPTVCFDATDADESRRARESFDEIMALGLELGGTITGEHGVGVLKKEWLAREIGPVGLEVQRAVKRAVDPLDLLNPGKLFCRPVRDGRRGGHGASSPASFSARPSCSLSLPGGTSRSVRSSHADTCAAGASSSASPSGELSAIS